MKTIIMVLSITLKADAHDVNNIDIFVKKNSNHRTFVLIIFNRYVLQNIYTYYFKLNIHSVCPVHFNGIVKLPR